MELASFVVGIVGLALAVASLLGWTLERRKRARWRSITRAVIALDRKINLQNFDVVIGLADGLVPAAIIVVNWRIKEVYFIDAPIANRANSPSAARLQLDGLPDVSGKKVLLIDNHCYTGTNLRAACEAVSARRPSQLTTAVLFRHTGATSVFVPDHSIYQVEGAVRSIPWSLTTAHRHDYLS